MPSTIQLRNNNYTVCKFFLVKLNPLSAIYYIYYGGPWVGLVPPNKFQALPNLNIKYLYFLYLNLENYCKHL